MNDLQTAAQQALEALERSETTVQYEGFGMARRDAERKHQAAIDALRAALAEPVEEPVLVVEKEPDYWSGGHFHQGSKPHIDPTKVWNLPIGTKLYTAPSQRKPLTEQEIIKIFADVLQYGTFFDVARAIERAHGIGGNDD